MGIMRSRPMAGAGTTVGEEFGGSLAAVVWAKLTAGHGRSGR